MRSDINNEDVVVKEMLRDCFGDDWKRRGYCVHLYFSRIREGMSDFETVLVPELGMLMPRFVLSLKRERRGTLPIRDIETVKRGAVRELDEWGYNDQYVEYFVREYGLERYMEEYKKEKNENK